MSDTYTLERQQDLLKKFAANADAPAADIPSAPIPRALSALEQTSSTHTLADFAAAAEAVQTTQAIIDEGRRESARMAFLQGEDDAKLSLSSLDQELIVGSMLGDVGAIMEDVLDEDVAVSDELVVLLTKTFRDMLRFVAAVPEHIAVEVGELAAATCTMLEEHDFDATPISSLFEPVR